MQRIKTHFLGKTNEDNVLVMFLILLTWYHNDKKNVVNLLLAPILQMFPSLATVSPPPRANM